MKRFCPLAAAVALVFLISGSTGLAAEERAPADKPAAEEKVREKVELTEPLVFKMEEVPAYGKDEVGGSARMRYPGGQLVRCTTTPSKEVKAYPELKSQRPLYGSIKVDGSPYDPGKGTTYCFVLDESGTAKEDAGKESQEKVVEERAPAKPGLLVERLVQRTTGPPRSVKSTYDRLCFDLNGDLDLTNDGVLKPAEKSPFEGLPSVTGAQAFEDILVSIDFGPPVGKRPFPLVLQNLITSPEQSYVQLVPKLARRGTVKIADQEFVAYLTQSRLISGRFDRPFVYLELMPVERSQRGRALLTSGYLGQLRTIDGQLVSLSATPLGDELTVAPYRGDVGVLEVGPGGRAITELGAIGGLVSQSMMVNLGETGVVRPPEQWPRRHLVPVGDYQPTTLTVRYGRLRFSARALRDTDLPAGEQPKAAAYAIKIRKDKPCVLEFSGKPEVIFQSPAKEQTYKPGDTVAIRVMLAEPQQGILISGLEDTTQKVGEETKVARLTRLDPTIVIRNSAGEEVATGKMPFG